MADALAALLRLRQLIADTARRDLASALAAEAQADTVCAAARAAVAAEAAALPGDAAHPLAGAFARWLPAGCQAVEDAAVIVRQAADGSAAARVGLAQARASFRAAETVADARRIVEAQATMRRRQKLLDDMVWRSA